MQITKNLLMTGEFHSASLLPSPTFLSVARAVKIINLLILMQ